MLQKELESKSQQLAVKDKQIDELNARLAESNVALVSAQQTAQELHAGAIQQQFLSSDSEIVSDAQDSNVTEKKNWFSRFFSVK